MTLLANRINIGQSYCTHFYLGNDYFNYGFNDESDTKNDNFNNNSNNIVFTGCDWMSVSKEWKEMFRIRILWDFNTINNINFILNPNHNNLNNNNLHNNIDNNPMETKDDTLNSDENNNNNNDINNNKLEPLVLPTMREMIDDMLKPSFENNERMTISCFSKYSVKKIFYIYIYIQYI